MMLVKKSLGYVGAIGRCSVEGCCNWDAGYSLKVALGDYDHYLDGRGRSVICIHHIRFSCGKFFMVFALWDFCS
jgi:hypothetical protein